MSWVCAECSIRNHNDADEWCRHCGETRTSITVTPPRPLPDDFPEDLCGDGFLFSFCRQPKGHTGLHYNGVEGIAASCWYYGGNATFGEGEA